MAGFGGLGLAAGVALSYLVIALASSSAIWQRPLKPFDRSTLNMLARYGLPITLSGLFVGVNLSLDRLFLAWIHGAELAGIYGAVADFVRQCAILPAISASMSIAPIAVAALADEKGGTVNDGLRDGVELLLAVLLPTVVGLALAAPEVAAIVLGPSYRDAAPTLIPIVAFAFMAHMISQQYIQLSFSLAKKPGYFIIHTGLILAVNLTLMVPLVRMWGLHGAALSLLIAETAGVLAGYMIARKVFPLPVGIHRLLRVAGSVLIMAAATWLASRTVEASVGVRLLVLVSTGIISYLAAAYWFDVVRIRGLVADLLRRSLSVEVPR
jgi:O-antigen/teichoic acid export membrane protein